MVKLGVVEVTDGPGDGSSINVPIELVRILFDPVFWLGVL